MNITMNETRRARRSIALALLFGAMAIGVLASSFPFWAKALATLGGGQ